MYRKVAALLLAAPVAIFASPFPQESPPAPPAAPPPPPSASPPPPPASPPPPPASSPAPPPPPITTSLSTVDAYPETVRIENVTATISNQTTTFSHYNGVYISTATDNKPHLYMDGALQTKVIDLIYNKQVCSNAPDRPSRSTNSSTTTPSTPTTSVSTTPVSTTSQTPSASPPTLSPSPTTATQSTPTPAAPSKPAPPAPSGNGTAQGDSCPVNGQLVCKPHDPTKFGLCNWGKVIWQDVAKGTECQNGTIVGVGIYSPAGHKRSQPAIGIPLSKAEVHSKRDDDSPQNLLDRPDPNSCFDPDMKALIDGMRPGGNFTDLVGLSTVVPGWEVQVLPSDNTNFTKYVTKWEDYANKTADLDWVNRAQLKESVDRIALFLLYPENWLDRFNSVIAEAQDDGRL